MDGWMDGCLKLWSIRFGVMLWPEEGGRVVANGVVIHLSPYFNAAENYNNLWGNYTKRDRIILFMSDSNWITDEGGGTIGKLRRDPIYWDNFASFRGAIYFIIGFNLRSIKSLNFPIYCYNFIRSFNSPMECSSSSPSSSWRRVMANSVSTFLLFIIFTSTSINSNSNTSLSFLPSIWPAIPSSDNLSLYMIVSAVCASLANAEVKNCNFQQY